jgi:hypothetical protein
MVLTDNGKAFTDRLFGLRKRSPRGLFDIVNLRTGPDAALR